MAVAGIVLAGGSGSRVEREINKVFLPIRDREMLAYSLDTMDRSPLVDRLVLVIREEDRGMVEGLVAEIAPSKLVDVVPGGASRHQSERWGIEALSEGIDSGEIDVVVVHDGARPFMTTELLGTVVAAARRSGGAVPGLPIEAPVYERTQEGTRPQPAGNLRRMQTPQAFRARPLLEAYRRAEADEQEGVDTAETVGRYTDLTVEVVPGDPRNIKVTFVEDMFEAEEHAAAWKRGAWTDARAGP